MKSVQLSSLDLVEAGLFKLTDLQSNGTFGASAILISTTREN